MNPIIVNPEDNEIVAKIINKALKGFKTSYVMKRDNCGDINDELAEYLNYQNIPTKMIEGLYKVDTYYGWLDDEDFSDNELDEIQSTYGNTYQESLEKYVDSLPDDEKEEYLYIPHVFLKCKNIILDAASDMFIGLGDRNKTRYFKSNQTPVI